MDSDIPNRSSDILRNVVMGRVMEDGSWTEVGRFSDVNITFHGKEMPDDFKTRYLTPWDEVSFTVDVEPTFAKKIADEIYEAHIKPLLSRMWDQLSNTEEICVCYANPDDRSAIEQRKSQVRDISWIRKQMKHCKNPMERKQLEKELNAAFKEKKKRRRKK